MYEINVINVIQGLKWFHKHLSLYLVTEQVVLCWGHSALGTEAGQWFQERSGEYIICSYSCVNSKLSSGSHVMDIVVMFITFLLLLLFNYLSSCLYETFPRFKTQSSQPNSKSRFPPDSETNTINELNKTSQSGIYLKITIIVLSKHDLI